MEAAGSQIIVVPEVHTMPGCNRWLTTNKLASYFSLAGHGYILKTHKIEKQKVSDLNSKNTL